MMVILAVLGILFAEATTVRSLGTFIILKTIAVRNLPVKHLIKVLCLTFLGRMDGLPGETLASVARHVELGLRPEPDSALEVAALMKDKTRAGLARLATVRNGDLTQIVVCWVTCD